MEQVGFDQCLCLCLESSPMEEESVSAHYDEGEEESEEDRKERCQLSTQASCCDEGHATALKREWEEKRREIDEKKRRVDMETVNFEDEDGEEKEGLGEGEYGVMKSV